MVELSKIEIGSTRTCGCPDNHSNCVTAREWLKSQFGVWQFNYEGRDIRDKDVHPATFPISLARRVIETFTHEGELVVDPFCGSGTTLLAANDSNRNAVGFDLNAKYCELAHSRLALSPSIFSNTKQVQICEDSVNAHYYLEPESVSLIWTSPPYANMLNRKRTNKSRKFRRTSQWQKVEQYSQDPRDLGTMEPDDFYESLGVIVGNLMPALKPGGHIVININDIWDRDRRIPLHRGVMDMMDELGLEYRNLIIWDKTNIMNNLSIFGWPNNYITITTYEFLLHFRKPLIDSKVQDEEQSDESAES